MENVPEILAAFGFFGAIFVVPLVIVLMKHQRAMAELLHRGSANDAIQRIESLEREVLELKNVRHEQILRQDDQGDISRRISH